MDCPRRSHGRIIEGCGSRKPHRPAGSARKGPLSASPSELRAVPGHVMHVAHQIPREFPREAHTVTVYEEAQYDFPRAGGERWRFSPSGDAGQCG